MLRLTIEGDEFFNEENNEFVTYGDVTISLEHSLVALSKWESKWEKPFLDNVDKSTEEIFSYIQMMGVPEEVPPEILDRLKQKHLDSITTYIDSKQTATWFYESTQTKPSSEKITSELMYYWMISLHIPLECAEWHLNKLFTLIKIFNIKNGPEKKMSPAEASAQRHEIIARRRAQLGSNG